MSRPRDSQRKKVYAAEREAFEWDFSRPEDHEMRTLASLEETVRLILTHPVVRARFKYAPYSVKFEATRARRGSAHGTSLIKLPRYARRPHNYAYVLHELTHIILTAELPGQTAWHGREYATTMLFLVDYFMGQTVAERLRVAYRKHGVKWRAKLRLSPERLAALRLRGFALRARRTKTELASAEASAP